MVLLAMFISMTTTTSKAIYTACVEKITKGYRDRSWRSVLLVGLLAGLAACVLGIGGTSGVELAMGKEPSISSNGTQIIPISPSPAIAEEPSISPNETQASPTSSPPPPTPLISYYYDSDGDKLGSGDPVKYERGSQPFGWVEQSGDKCPDIPGPLKREGCPRPPPLIWYFSDVDGDGIGDRIEPGSPTQYERGSQPVGWVEQNGDNCPLVSNPDQVDTHGDGHGGDACRIVEPPKEPKQSPGDAKT
jgi:hypothetical protein